MLENYKKVHPRFEAAFEGLKKLVAENAEVGKYEIEGSDVYAMVQEMNGTKSVTTTRWSSGTILVFQDQLVWAVAGKLVHRSATM